VTDKYPAAFFFFFLVIIIGQCFHLYPRSL